MNAVLPNRPGAQKTTNDSHCAAAVGIEAQIVTVALKPVYVLAARISADSAAPMTTTRQPPPKTLLF